jgi:hypothetical protein
MESMTQDLTLIIIGLCCLIVVIALEAYTQGFKKCSQINERERMIFFKRINAAFDVEEHSKGVIELKDENIIQ